MQIYAPTNDADEEQKDKFYEKLRSMWQQRRYDMIDIIVATPILILRLVTIQIALKE